MEIAICDVGLGNLRSVERALVHAADEAGLAVRVTISNDPDLLRRADKLVAPGQGAFRDCARALDAGMGALLKERIKSGTPYFGICLGLQVLFGASEEAPGCSGLGIFAGDVAKLPGGIDESTGASLKIPHVGWNVAIPSAHASGHASDEARGRSFLPEKPAHFYFVHSYAVRPADASIIAATTDYGIPFVSAVAKDNVFACQFHPEKSQSEGLALLTRFLKA